MIRRQPRYTHCISSAASDVYKRQDLNTIDLGKELGLTLLSDTNRADIKNVIPTMVPQYDYILGCLLYTSPSPRDS